MIIKIGLYLKFNNIIFEVIKLNMLIDIKIGHGLKVKMKYGWLIFFIYSLEYNEESIENTYLWIIATHSSNIIIKICRIIIISMIEL